MTTIDAQITTIVISQVRAQSILVRTRKAGGGRRIGANALERGGVAPPTPTPSAGGCWRGGVKLRVRLMAGGATFGAIAAAGAPVECRDGGNILGRLGSDPSDGGALGTASEGGLSRVDAIVDWRAAIVGGGIRSVF